MDDLTCEGDSTLRIHQPTLQNFEIEAFLGGATTRLNPTTYSWFGICKIVWSDWWVSDTTWAIELRDKNKGNECGQVSLMLPLLLTCCRQQLRGWELGTGERGAVGPLKTQPCFLPSIIKYNYKKKIWCDSNCWQELRLSYYLLSC